MGDFLGKKISLQFAYLFLFQKLKLENRLPRSPVELGQLPNDQVQTVPKSVSPPKINNHHYYLLAHQSSRNHTLSWDTISVMTYFTLVLINRTCSPRTAPWFVLRGWAIHNRVPQPRLQLCMRGTHSQLISPIPFIPMMLRVVHQCHQLALLNRRHQETLRKVFILTFIF